MFKDHDITDPAVYFKILDRCGHCDSLIEVRETNYGDFLIRCSKCVNNMLILKQELSYLRILEWNKKQREQKRFRQKGKGDEFRFKIEPKKEASMR